MLNMDDLHFLLRKHKAQFKLKAQIFHYIINNRAIAKESDELLNKMKFKFSFTWSYDPLGIISKLRVEHKTTPYPHTS